MSGQLGDIHRALEATSRFAGSGSRYTDSKPKGRRGARSGQGSRTRQQQNAEISRNKGRLEQEQAKDVMAQHKLEIQRIFGLTANIWKHLEINSRLYYDDLLQVNIKRTRGKKVPDNVSSFFRGSVFDWKRGMHVSGGSTYTYKCLVRNPDDLALDDEGYLNITTDGGAFSVPFTSKVSVRSKTPINLLYKTDDFKNCFARYYANGTVIHIARHNGRNIVHTHSNLDIAGTNAHVGSSKSFWQAYKDAGGPKVSSLFPDDVKFSPYVYRFMLSLPQNTWGSMIDFRDQYLTFMGVQKFWDYDEMIAKGSLKDNVVRDNRNAAEILSLSNLVENKNLVFYNVEDIHRYDGEGIFYPLRTKTLNLDGVKDMLKYGILKSRDQDEREAEKARLDKVREATPKYGRGEAVILTWRDTDGYDKSVMLYGEDYVYRQNSIMVRTEDDEVGNTNESDRVILNHKMQALLKEWKDIPTPDIPIVPCKYIFIDDVLNVQLRNVLNTKVDTGELYGDTLPISSPELGDAIFDDLVTRRPSVVELHSAMIEYGLLDYDTRLREAMAFTHYIMSIPTSQRPTMWEEWRIFTNSRSNAHKWIFDKIVSEDFVVNSVSKYRDQVMDILVDIKTSSDDDFDINRDKYGEARDGPNRHLSKYIFVQLLGYDLDTMAMINTVMREDKMEEEEREQLRERTQAKYSKSKTQSMSGFSIPEYPRSRGPVVKVDDFSESLSSTKKVDKPRIVQQPSRKTQYRPSDRERSKRRMEMADYMAKV